MSPLAGLLLPLLLLPAAPDPAERPIDLEEAAKTARNHGKELGIALWIHHDAVGHLPAVANFDKNDKPLLSWRVHLLPYLEQKDLYKQFHLDEPWDSEHNKKLIAKMPKVFANPYNLKLAADGKTTYLAPVHKDAVFTGDKTGILLKDITDGLSLTVLLVDVDDADAVIWTKPDDLKLDPKNPAKSLIARHSDKFQLVFADGSVQLISKKIDKNTLWALFTRAGGEVVNLR
jgi:prepilin-type processing-associated H-X9-DG protein